MTLKVSLKQRAEIGRDYQNGMSIRDVGEKHGFSFTFVRSVLIQGGIALRPRTTPSQRRSLAYAEKEARLKSQGADAERDRIAAWLERHARLLTIESAAASIRNGSHRLAKARAA